MERARIVLNTLGMRELLSRLAELRPAGAPAFVAFDGDGTLWSGDVGEDVFHHAVGHRLLREAALPALRDAARAHTLSPEGDANDVAARIFEAYRAGSFPEREVCDVMTWCYAGFAADELAAYCRDVLLRARIGERLERDLEPVFEHCRATGVGVVVVSASPRPAVEAAAELWSISPAEVAASTPAQEAGVVVPRNAAYVPYSEAKVSAARSVSGDRLWLASFGDNVFDIEMLQAARIGVAVRPKVALRKRLAELESVVLLQG